MCNLWTNTHTFVWSGSNTNDQPPEDLPCQCGQAIFRELKPFIKIDPTHKAIDEIIKIASDENKGV